MKKVAIFGPESILKRGKLQACRIVVAGFFYACLSTISGHAALPGQTVMECLSPLKVDSTGPGCMAAFLFDEVFRGMESTENNRCRAKHSSPKTTSAERHRQKLISILQDYFDGVPASVAAEYLGYLITGYAGSETTDDPIQLADTVYHGTRTVALIVALQEALKQEVCHG